VWALAIIGARARKQRQILLELTDNGAGGVLTLRANILAIIALCSPTEGCAHNSCQWGKAIGFTTCYSKTHWAKNQTNALQFCAMRTPGARVSFSKVIDRLRFRNIEIENTFENSMAV
jgi:hypothetical protein